MMISTPTTTDRVITVSLDCRAPKQKVFETWTQPEWLKKWFKADEGYVCGVAEVDLRPGGRYRIAMARGGDADTVFTGTYQSVVVPDGLVYTWSGGEGDHVTLVTALFHDAGKGSRVEFAHGVFATQQACDAHAQGWLACFRMFGSVVDGGAP